MANLFFYHLQESLRKIKDFIERNEGAIKNSKDYREVVAEFDNIEKYVSGEQNHYTFKRQNFYISIIPTIVASLLTVWVAFLSIRNSRKHDRLQEVSMLKDSLINLSTQLNSVQSSHFQVDSLIKRDSLYRRVTNEKYDSDRTFIYGGDRFMNALIDKYLETIALSSDLKVRIDSLKQEIRAKEAPGSP